MASNYPHERHAGRRMLRMQTGFGRLSVWLITLFSLSLFSLAFAFVSYKSREDSWRLGEQAIDNVGRLAEQSIAREIELYNLSLQAVVDGALDPRIMGQDPDIRAQILFDRSATATGFGYIIATNVNGDIILDSKSIQPRRANMAGRDFFDFHTQEYGDNGLYISRPFKAKMDNDRWTVALSRRITAPDGTFRGIVSGFIKLDYFNRILQRASLGSEGVVTLLRDDGSLIGRSPFDEKLLGHGWQPTDVSNYLANAPKGFFTKHGIGDGRERLYTCRRVTGTPLFITVGLGVNEILGLWRSRTIMSSAIFIVLAGSVLVLMAMLNRELVRRASAEQAAQLLARTDALTGVANRRMFDEALHKEISRASRQGDRVSLLMLDVDWFKKYNDAYGHRRGDEVLARVSQMIKTSVRSDVGLVARYGGEEFAVIVTHIDADDVGIIAHRILENISALAIPFPESAFGHLTVSCGIATRTCGAAESAAGLIEEADQRLYQAKKSGRNRIECPSDYAELAA